MARKCFNAEIIELIEAVERRPCIWDKREEDYKDRLQRDKAWKEVCRIFDKNYEISDPTEQRNIEAAVINKWRNIRDAFFKAVKKQKKNYLYENHLLFLLPTLPKNELTLSNIEKLENEDEKSQEIRDKKLEQLIEAREKLRQKTNFQQETCRKRKRVVSTDSEKDLVVTRSETSQSLPDEDESFFMSILPSVREFDRDEKLQFRVEVIHLIQKMKRQSHSSGKR